MLDGDLRPCCAVSHASIDLQQLLCSCSHVPPHTFPVSSHMCSDLLQMEFAFWVCPATNPAQHVCACGGGQRGAPPNAQRPAARQARPCSGCAPPYSWAQVWWELQMARGFSVLCVGVAHSCPMGSLNTHNVMALDNNKGVWEQVQGVLRCRPTRGLRRPQAVFEPPHPAATHVRQSTHKHSVPQGRHWRL